MQVNLDRTRSLIEPVVNQLGFELVDLVVTTEHGRQVLQILIDRQEGDGGVTVGDCQQVSREIETLLEVEEAVRSRYFLEVSSPGLDRPLVKETDFRKYAGREARLKTREPIEGRSNYKGCLKGVDDGSVVMTIDGKEYRIPAALIEKARLVF